MPSFNFYTPPIRKADTISNHFLAGNLTLRVRLQAVLDGSIYEVVNITTLQSSSGAAQLVEMTLMLTGGTFAGLTVTLTENDQDLFEIV